MKLWEIICTIKDMGGTMEDVRTLMQAGVLSDTAEKSMETEEKPVETGEKPLETEEKPVETVDNSEELEALRLENAKLKGQLQTYNILHASINEPPTVSPADSAVEMGMDMIK